MRVKLMEFVSYELVRRSGKYNMVMDAVDASKEAGLILGRYHQIMENYQKLYDRWHGKYFMIRETLDDYSCVLMDDMKHACVYGWEEACDTLMYCKVGTPSSHWEMIECLRMDHTLIFSNSWEHLVKYSTEDQELLILLQVFKKNGESWVRYGTIGSYEIMDGELDFDADGFRVISEFRSMKGELELESGILDHIVSNYFREVEI